MSVNIQIKVTEQYFHVVLSIMLYWGGSNLWVWDEILKCDHSNPGRLLALLCNADRFHMFQYFALRLFSFIEIPTEYWFSFNKQNVPNREYNCGTYETYTIVKSDCVRNV